MEKIIECPNPKCRSKVKIKRCGGTGCLNEIVEKDFCCYHFFSVGLSEKELKQKRDEETRCPECNYILIK
jgi:hypothetical protein